MNQETLLAQKIAHLLDQGRSNISPDITARLHAARTQALARQRQPVAVLSLAGFGAWAGDFLRAGIRTSVLLLSLTLALGGTLYWEKYMQADENEEIDSALLADELPIDAYLDDGFQIWVNRSEQSSSY